MCACFAVSSQGQYEGEMGTAVLTPTTQRFLLLNHEHVRTLKVAVIALLIANSCLFSKVTLHWIAPRKRSGAIPGAHELH